MRRITGMILSGSFAALGCLPALAESVATYEIEFDVTWSPQTHPGAFPGNAHFSRLVGATHNSAVSFWNAGEVASNGIEQMAERGQTAPLIAEIEPAITAGTARSTILGFSMSDLPRSRSDTFEVYESHPLVTLVTMIAPSPDWFVGVSSLPLRENGAWRGQITVDMWGYDAGTDDGTAFVDINADTDPAEPIHLITVPPLGGLPPLGTFTFTIQPGVVPGDFDLDGDNDADDGRIWQRGYGAFPAGGAFVSDGDANGDGIIDGKDFLIGQSGSAVRVDVSQVARPIPEPATMIWATLSALLVYPRRR